MVVEAVVLALVASVFTALASVAQRMAAATTPESVGFSWRLIAALLRRPMWFAGIACMILGFVFQVSALRAGTLSLVQPIIAVELVIVFALIALVDHRTLQGTDWLAAVGMVVGVGLFLAVARPHGGHDHSSGWHWMAAAAMTFGLAGLVSLVTAVHRRDGARLNGNTRAALLGVAAAVAFGFVAAVIKELATDLPHGLLGVLESWPPYALIASGAAAMFLASNAFQAGSLAASQPGLTIVDPVVATFLGVALFRERLNTTPVGLELEVLALAVTVASVLLLVRSPLFKEGAAPHASTGEVAGAGGTACPPPAGPGTGAAALGGPCTTQ